jgi:hypothetical protein
MPRGHRRPPLLPRRWWRCTWLDLDRLFVLVWDCCPLPPVHRGPAGDDAETGRGLEIVSLIADRWGTAVPDEGGKVVWAQLSTASQEAT